MWLIVDASDPIRCCCCCCSAVLLLLLRVHILLHPAEHCRPPKPGATNFAEAGPGGVDRLLIVRLIVPAESVTDLRLIGRRVAFNRLAALADSLIAFLAFNFLIVARSLFLRSCTLPAKTKHTRFTHCSIHKQSSALPLPDRFTLPQRVQQSRATVVFLRSYQEIFQRILPNTLGTTRRAGDCLRS